MINKIIEYLEKRNEALVASYDYNTNKYIKEENKFKANLYFERAETSAHKLAEVSRALEAVKQIKNESEQEPCEDCNNYITGDIDGWDFYPKYCYECGRALDPNVYNYLK